MILKGNQRGGGKQLALHLLNAKDNEHVHVHELRGFTADDLEGAFQEAHAVSRGTRCKQFLYSLSLNPPQDANVRTDEFVAAIDAVEIKLGLNGQPRAIVFHEKDGRRHAHAVWSRIDAEQMRAVNLSCDRLKLRDISRSLYLEHGWQMPRGLVNSREKDPASYSLAEWQQAKRAGHDPKALKSMFQELWASSDSGKAFDAALKSRGYTLAHGDRRGFVAVDYRGEVYAIARYTGAKTKDVKSRLEDQSTLPSVDQAKAEHSSRMTEMLRRHAREIEARERVQAAKFSFCKAETIQRQREQRERLMKAQGTRHATETLERTRRYTKGFRGLWDRVTGAHAEIRKQNEREAWMSLRRDQVARDALIFQHQKERRSLHAAIKQARQVSTEKIAELHRDIAGFTPARGDPPQQTREPVTQTPKLQELRSRRQRTQSRDRGREPDF